MSCVCVCGGVCGCVLCMDVVCMRVGGCMWVCVAVCGVFDVSGVCGMCGVYVWIEKCCIFVGREKETSGEDIQE